MPVGVLAGERNHGEYNNLLHQTEAQIARSMISYDAEIAEHSRKIANPAAYIEAWHLKDPRYQQGLLRRWGKEVASFKEKRALAQYVLLKRRR